MSEQRMLEAASQLERFHGRHSQFNQRGSVPKGAITQFRLLLTQPVFFSLIILYHLVEQIFHHTSLINPTNSRPNFFFKTVVIFCESWIHSALHAIHLAPNVNLSLLFSRWTPYYCHSKTLSFKIASASVGVGFKRNLTLSVCFWPTFPRNLEMIPRNIPTIQFDKPPTPIPSCPKPLFQSDDKCDECLNFFADVH